MFKNVANQKAACYAWGGAAGSAKTGDAANITAQISIDGAATAPTDDVNPTELDATDAPGIYIFDLTQAETNGDLIIISPVSSTADVVIRPIIAYTNPLTPTKAGYIDASINTNSVDINSALSNQVLMAIDLAAILVDTDTMEADLKTYMDTIESNIRGTDSDDLKDISDEVAAIAPATATIEGTLTMKHVLAILLARAAGEASGGRTAELKWRNQADNLDRITMAVDRNGNRFTVTLDVSDL